MKFYKLKILPGVGLCPLRFGLSPQEAQLMLGPPEAKVEPDADGDVCFDYIKNGVFLTFSRDHAFRLMSIEVNPGSKATLWGEKVFDLKRSEILDLFEARGYALRRAHETAASDTEVTGKSLVQSHLALNLFFDDSGRLDGVSWGPLHKNDQIVWPGGPKNKNK